jgi:hypothetical protein
LIHHHNLEPECKEEKNAIIRTLSHFKKFTLTYLNKMNISFEKLEKEKEFVDLKNNYDELEKKLLDPDYFFLTLGENFEDIPN